jgi:hypothetical protein
MAFDQLRSDLRKQFVEFLLVDAELGLTFAALAQAPQRAREGRKKSYENASKAYDVVKRLQQRVTLTEGEHQKLSSTLQRLKTILIDLAQELK